ncbi:MAG TPA: class E sortase [Bacillota bacterium]|nr:class E sortase [Bacillota bacterium]HPT88379.1 class E sortase [Bacillota bacterium]
MKRIGWLITVVLGLSLFYPWATHLVNRWIQLQPVQLVEEPTPVSPTVLSPSGTVENIPVKPDIENPSDPNVIFPQPRKDVKRPSIPKPKSIPPKPQPPSAATYVLEIPALGIKRAVYEGASPANLRRGPSHMLESAPYGETGICLIAGHRTTYGAPFRYVDRLAPGDLILIRNQKITYEYIVQDQRVVDANYKTDFQSETQELHLSTCHPPHSAKKRLLIRCRLRQSF